MSSFNKKFDHLKIPLRDVLTATNNFGDENVIRKDGFGKEYKGRLVLRSGESIDIVARRLDRRAGHGTKEFQTEVMMLSSLKHQNVTSIVGFCDENEEKVVIINCKAKGSLDQYLNDPVTLTWTRRLHICLGIARALSYIHYDEGRSFSIIHRDVKSNKILLDDKWEPKLCGFELSIMQPAARRHGLVLDLPCGTFGFMDPAYLGSSSVNHKSDVHSFGVVLFEVLSGRKAFIQDSGSNEMVFLAKLAKSHYEKGTLNEIIHPDIHNQIDSQALKVFSEAAYWCLKDQRLQRPHMDRVIIALNQALELQLPYENKLKERSVEGTSAYHSKGKDLEHFKIKFEAIKLATENFAEKNCIGFGGYGIVYKAELEHFDSFAERGSKESELPRRRSTVAIKCIFNRDGKEGEQGFITEIETLSGCVHPNIVSLYGFCYEPPHMILVYEHVSNGSLDNYFESDGKMTKFTWVQRLKICIDIARGLDYIHTMDNKQKIIHRDIKSANILLGENWEAKIADFGLSKIHPFNNTKSTLNTNNIAGTMVYLDPEYEKTGKLKKESDVYSFGVVLFEILSGRLAYDPVYIKKNEKGLAPIVREHFKNGTIKEMVDPVLIEENSFTLSKGPNQDSLNIFLTIGYKCLAEKQVERPKMKFVIKELENALNFQETHSDNLRISLEDIERATQNFNNLIGNGGFGGVYRGEILHANRPTPIAVKRHNEMGHQGEKEFLTELEILFEYKHKNIIGLIGYCNENNEKILVYEYASKGSLDRHVKDDSLTWTERLKIAIDVAIGLEFLHEADPTVIHRDIKSSNILLNDGWRTKISDFGLSIITSLSNEIDFVIDDACGTQAYVDPQYVTSGFLTRESDIYSLGVVLFEMMCGRLAVETHEDDQRSGYLVNLVKRYYEERRVDELVFEGIKDKIVSKSLTLFVKIAYECLHDDIKKRPTASKVALQLKEALEFQEDVEIWEVKLPKDYKQIVQMSKTPEKYSNLSNKDLYEVFSKGILLQNDKVCLSISSNGERNEMVSATMFSYGNNLLFNKRISIQNSRFKRVVKIMNIINLNIHIKIKTQFLSLNVHYGAHLVFKFCEPRKSSANLMYVNLKYQMGSETQHAYFATRGDDEWMMIELCRFIPHKKDVEFDVLLESLSRYYCGGGAIYVEGLYFRAINDATSKLFSISKADDKKCHMLPAKMVLHDTSDVNRFNWKSLAESRFQEVVELLSNQILRIKCKIEAQKLSADTDYACYLVFKLSPKCHGLQCPVKVQDVLLRKNKEFKFLYLRPPRLVYVHGNGRVPKLREDGLMEVIVSEFNSRDMKPDDDQIRMSLKLRCYEGTMSGLLVYGVEFRPI